LKQEGGSVHDEKKVSFSRLVNDDPDGGGGNMELPPEKGKSVEELLSGVIRELRVKDDAKQETEAFPPCVAHGLAVRMDVISQSLVRVQTDVTDMKRDLARVLDQQDLIIMQNLKSSDNINNISQSLARVQTDVTDIKRDLVRVLDQQDPGDNINNNNNKNKNNNNNKNNSKNKSREQEQQQQEWQDHSPVEEEAVEEEEDNDDYNLSQPAPSQLDVMMMMLGQSNNIFYSRQPTSFVRSGSEAGCCVQPGPFCHRPITPPSQIVSLEEETLDEANNNNSDDYAAVAGPAACRSPPPPTQNESSDGSLNGSHS